MNGSYVWDVFIKFNDDWKDWDIVLNKLLRMGFDEKDGDIKKMLEQLKINNVWFGWDD